MEFVFVDDDPASVAIARLRSLGLAKSQAYTPDEVNDAILEDALVVLVDFDLDIWLREKQNSPLVPKNGLALAATFRSFFQQGDLTRTQRSPFAVALYSGRTDHMSNLPALYRQHALGRLHDIEWAFEKTNTDAGLKELSVQLRCLGNAVSDIKRNWMQYSNEPRRFIESILEIPHDDSESRILQEVDDARPPIHDLSLASHGMSVLRWLLHRILPYPGILWSFEYLAARFRLTTSQFQAVLANKANVREAVERSRYTGSLRNFLSDRYWRARIENELWTLTSGRPFDPAAIATLTAIPLDSPADLVLCIDANFEPQLDRLFPVEQTIRVVPDDWPTFAEPALMPIEVVKSAGLADLVPEADRFRLDA